MTKKQTKYYVIEQGETREPEVSTLDAEGLFNLAVGYGHDSDLDTLSSVTDLLDSCPNVRVFPTPDELRAYATSFFGRYATRLRALIKAELAE